MDAADIDRIERAQACLWRARAESSKADMPGLTGELMHHLDMVLRVVTSIRITSGELDDAPLAVTHPTTQRDSAASRKTEYISNSLRRSLRGRRKYAKDKPELS